MGKTATQKYFFGVKHNSQIGDMCFGYKCSFLSKTLGVETILFCLVKKNGMCLPEIESIVHTDQMRTDNNAHGHTS